MRSNVNAQVNNKPKAALRENTTDVPSDKIGPHNQRIPI